DKRYDFALLFDVTNGNPNGDPDAGNAPRIDPETGHGLVSDVCIKRKIRNYICLAKGGNGTPEDGYDIYVKERAVLNQQHQLAYEAVGLDSETQAEIEDGLKGIEDKKRRENEKKKLTQLFARAWMCQHFFDVRMFGAVMSTGVNCGQVRGPVQFAFARSIDPIVALEQSITRMAVTTEKESEKQEGGNRTMGRKEIVPYALYEIHGFISPHLAADTGFSTDDLELLWSSLKTMFEHDRSAARGEMTSRKLVVFEHKNALGNAPAHTLFDRISVARKDESKPARAYSDYAVTVDEENLPAGITVHDMI
ncbi:MAG: type I-C CRISPR-associated protein Cas7/Csd2, partial [Nitrospiraceae bacterium]|nr:type I-C CRISPR-associated protein Cas7/Csd2 [Nitrospiraceae bacterium]